MRTITFYTSIESYFEPGLTNGSQLPNAESCLLGLSISMERPLDIVLFFIIIIIFFRQKKILHFNSYRKTIETVKLDFSKDAHS